MKNITSILSLVAVAAFVAPEANLYANEPTVPATQAASTKRLGTVSYEIPVLTVNKKGGRFERLYFEYTRRKSTRSLVVSIGDSQSGGSGAEIRASVWSAGVVAALMRNDLMEGVRINVDFSGPVDGPSAGGVFCLAILSALDGREFPKDFAMTGTILPDGTIGLVGGVEEKIKAAAKAGIKRVCIPALGRVEESKGDFLKDLVRVAEKEGVELILVETIEEAYCAAHKLPFPEKKVISEREVLSVDRISEDIWYDDVFDNFNRARAIVRCHESKGDNDDPFLSRYRDDLQRSVKLLKNGFFQRVAENSFECLIFMRAWDESIAEAEAFWRNYPNGKSIREDVLKNPEASVSKEDLELLSAFRKHMSEALGRAIEMPGPEEGDKDVPVAPEGRGFYRDASWTTEITAQLEPVLATEDMFAWKDFFEGMEKENLSDIKTKDDLWWQIKLAHYKELLLRVGIIRDNERAYFLEVASTIPQIYGNENLLKASGFYHTAVTTVYQSLKSSFSEYFGNDRQLHRFGYGSYTSDARFDAVQSGEKIADPKYNALARIITDCRLLALGAALQIKYGPDIGRVDVEDVWVESYGNSYFLDVLIRLARVQALNNIKKCRDKNIPCPAALSAFSEADTSRGDRKRDQLFDVLANYWLAGNIAQALNLCFDSQPSLADSAENGNADALFLLGHHEGLFGDIKKAEEFLRKSAEQGDARAQYWLAVILENNEDKKAALSWVEKSAKQNYVPALERLAWRYWTGEEGIVEKDQKKAFSLFKTAAYLGSTGAQERLAWCYINEEDVVKEDVLRGRIWQWLAAERDDRFAQIRLANDYRHFAKKNPDRWLDAFRWFSRAAEQGHARAAADLGDCYWFGHGVEKDQKLAAEWFKKSAEGGNEYGQYNYGFCLYNGGGVETNREEGLMWLRRAAENGSENAKKYLEELNGDETGGGSEASSPSASTTEDDSLLTVSLGDNVSMTFVTISEGKFTMGSPKSEDGRYTDENQVSVELSSFWIGQTEVTQAQWKSVMGNNPSYFKGDSFPVEWVSWDEAMEFCRKLTERERKKGLPEDYKFTLPTEAQWEYACRAGTTTRFSFGNSDRNLYLYGNFYDRSGDTKYDAAFREKNGWKIPPDTSQDDGFVETAPVGSFRPNAWGLYDMHGNVWEWCLDYYNPSLAGGENPYRTTPGSGDYGSVRVNRGGSWNGSAQGCRSAYRDFDSPDDRSNDLGFRVALVRE